MNQCVTNSGSARCQSGEIQLSQFGDVFSAGSSYGAGLYDACAWDQNGKIAEARFVHSESEIIGDVISVSGSECFEFVSDNGSLSIAQKDSVERTVNFRVCKK